MPILFKNELSAFLAKELVFIFEKYQLKTLRPSNFDIKKSYICNFIIEYPYVQECHNKDIWSFDKKATICEKILHTKCNTTGCPLWLEKPEKLEKGWFLRNQLKKLETYNIYFTTEAGKLNFFTEYIELGTHHPRGTFTVIELVPRVLILQIIDQ